MEKPLASGQGVKILDQKNRGGGGGGRGGSTKIPSQFKGLTFKNG